MSSGIRVKLSFHNTFNECTRNLKKSWVFVNKSFTRSVEDFIDQIRDKFQISKTCGIHLELEGYLLPSEEQIDIIRDNDEIRVIKNCDFIHLTEDEILEEVSVNTDNIKSKNAEHQPHLPTEPLVHLRTNATNSPSDKGHTLAERDGNHLRDAEFSSKQAGVLHEDAQETLNRCQAPKEIQYSKALCSSETSNDLKLIPDKSNTECLNNKDSLKEDVPNEASVIETSTSFKRKRKRKRHNKSKLNNSIPNGEHAALESGSESEEISEAKKFRQTSDFKAQPFLYATSSMSVEKSRQADNKTESSGKIKVFKRNQTVAMEVAQPTATTKPVNLVTTKEIVPTILRFPPAVGSVIKFKMLELSHDYTPSVSDYKKAEVISHCPSNKNIQLRLLEGTNETNLDGRFELTIEDQDQILTNKPPSSDKMSVAWNELIEPTLA